METKYILLKTYENPCKKIHEGVSKTEEEWIKIFPDLNKGDCDIKKDWFKKVEINRITSIVEIEEFCAKLSMANIEIPENIVLFLTIDEQVKMFSGLWAYQIVKSNLSKIQTNTQSINVRTELK